MTKPSLRIEDLVANRDFSWMIEPLDYLIIQKLPDEGTNIGGLYQVGTTVSDMLKDFSPVTPGNLSGRLRAMHMGTLVRPVKMIGGKAGKARAWQKTKLGKEVLEEWQATQQ